MPTITERVTTTIDVDYITPVYRTIYGKHIKIFDTNKMIVVDPTANAESITIVAYPNVTLGINAIAVTTASDEATFNAQYAAVEAILDAI